MRIGAHLPVAKGLVRAARRARRLRLDCLQLFVRNPRGWRARPYPDEEVSRFRALLASAGIAPLTIHSCYLVNLASPDKQLRHRSLRAVADDSARAALLGASVVVFHMGHHMGTGVSAALRTLARSLRSLLPDLPPGVSLLVENAAGRGSELGGEWTQFVQMLDLLHGDERVGVCFDTCHAHAAGYRLDRSRWVSRSLADFRSALDMSRLRLIHLNDCAAPAGARRDLHQHIGQGTIGDLGFRAFLRRRELQHLCAILETPLDRPRDDLRNVRHVRELMGRLQ